MAVADVAQLSARLEALATEHQICRQKLESKCEALMILSRELAECRSERDQFKLMAEQLRERYQVLKRQLAGHRPISPTHDDSSSNVDLKEYATSQGQGLAQVLIEYREQAKSLQFEVDDLKQKLHDAQGDIKLLREQIVRSRVGTTDEGMTTRHFPAYEREDLVTQLEASREQTVQLERDLQQVLDEKQELVTERDAYRHKYGRLNTELNYILKGHEKGVVDIDALIMENKYLQERIKQMEEEKAMAMDTVSKYKSILEKKKNKGILKVGQNRSGGLIISQKQVKEMVHNKAAVPPTPQAMADLQSLCSALHDSVTDKSLALSHQRKANKLLGSRVSELEKKLKTLEVAGLWSVSEHMSSLDKLRQECSEVQSEVKMLVPCQRSESSEASDPPGGLHHDPLSDLSSDSLPQTPSDGHSPAHSASFNSSSLNASSVGSASLNSSLNLTSLNSSSSSAPLNPSLQLHPTSLKFSAPFNPSLQLLSPSLNSAPLNSSSFNPASLNSSPLNSAPLNSSSLNPTPVNASPLNSTPLNSSSMNSSSLNPSSNGAALSSARELLSTFGACDMEDDLDLLPTREEVMKHVGDEESVQTLSEAGECYTLKGSSHDNLDDREEEEDEEETNPDEEEEEEEEDEEKDNDADEDDDEDETPESENCHLLGGAGEEEDQETVRQLQDFMEQVTSKIRHINHNGRPAPPPPPPPPPPPATRPLTAQHGDSASVALETECKVSAAASQSESLQPPPPSVPSSSKQPLLREMSEPDQGLGSDDKSVEC